MSNQHLKKITKVHIHSLVETTTAQKIHKIYKTVEMYRTQKNELNNVGAHRREPRFGRKRNVLGARDLRMDIGAHPGSPTQPC